MNSIVFINPSQNMNLVQNMVQTMGRETIKIYTKDYSPHKCDNAWICLDSSISGLLNKNSIAADQMICDIKKPFFASLNRKNVRNKLLQVNLNPESCSFQDYIILTAQVRKQRSETSPSGKKSFDEIVKSYPNSIIVASEIPSPSGKVYITKWRTDYDLKESLANDHFFFFNKKGRHELYRNENNELITISEHSPRVDWLKDINPSFIRFAFEKMSSITVHQNRQNCIIKHSSKIYLVNDYSWQTLFTQMPDNWVKNMAKHLCSIKK